MAMMACSLKASNFVNECIIRTMLTANLLTEMTGLVSGIGIRTERR